MYGAILGDIIGSPFEFDRGNKSKDFELFSNGAEFTDDSVMTVAVAEALLSAGKNASLEEIRNNVIYAMQKWGKKYPYAGYGGRFIGWLSSKNPAPYGSYGNGSAMRVSAAGWLYDTLERTREVARATAEVTHNHTEGIKGAESVASAIFLARTGSSKDEIKAYIEAEFHYDLSRTCDEIRPTYYHVESCQKTVPEAITAFLEGTDFEDVIRTAVSLGGDCDTLTAIAGSMAEAFYGVPALLLAECRSRLPKDLLEIVERFDYALGRKVGADADIVNPFLKKN
jgi:ADP-ribosylglycohydrolase